MAKTLGEALRLLNKLGGFDIMSISMDNNSTTEHNIKHNFRAVMYCPIAAISNNCAFIMSNGDKYLTTADGIRCKVVDWKQKHICDLEEEIQKAYGVDAWTFCKKWHKSIPYFDSMHFLIINVVKEENRNE